MLPVAVEFDILDSARYLLLQIVAQLPGQFILTIELKPGQFSRASKGDNGRDILGAGAVVALMMAACHLRSEPDAFAHVERADAFRCVICMLRYRQQRVFMRLTIYHTLAIV